MLIRLPKSSHPDPSDGRAPATALYGYMLEELMSHQIHHDVIGDIDKKFTPPVNADFYVILTTAMHDLKHAYDISG